MATTSSSGSKFNGQAFIRSGPYLEANSKGVNNHARSYLQQEFLQVKPMITPNHLIPPIVGVRLLYFVYFSDAVGRNRHA